MLAHTFSRSSVQVSKGDLHLRFIFYEYIRLTGIQPGLVRFEGSGVCGCALEDEIAWIRLEVQIRFLKGIGKLQRAHDFMLLSAVELNPSDLMARWGAHGVLYNTVQQSLQSLPRLRLPGA